MTDLTIDYFTARFFELTQDWSWEVQGFLDSNGYVHPIDTDTKVISTVFERICAPVIRTIAAELGYIVENANQTTYPDFTMTNLSTKHRIALDIKTTYTRSKMMFTLGGYNSFLRNGTKNILYPYASYGSHWVLGFVYKQLVSFKEYDLSSLPKVGEITCPYMVEAVFVREKFELCGLRAGSGNTKNIGSFSGSSPADFVTKSGPFATMSKGKEASDYYWANYEMYCPQIKSVNDLLTHKDFARFV